MILISAIATAALAAVHLFSPRLSFLDKVPRSRWLSAAGGISTAYVFVHLLPELAHFDLHVLSGQSEAIYVITLAGLVLFYALERWVKMHDEANDTGQALPAASFWLHLGVFAIHNLLIGYLTPERARDEGAAGLSIYAVAMILHFVVNDRGLHAHHGPRYIHQGRWILALAPFIGLMLGLAVTVPVAVVGALLAFLGAASF
ncbi:MAG: hypothetical protein ACU0GG_05070 [Paracoccaceae bacterium]